MARHSPRLSVWCRSKLMGVKQGAFATLHVAQPPGQGQSFGPCSFGQHGQDGTLQGLDGLLAGQHDEHGPFAATPLVMHRLHFFAFDSSVAVVPEGWLELGAVRIQWSSAKLACVFARRYALTLTSETRRSQNRGTTHFLCSNKNHTPTISSSAELFNPNQYFRPNRPNRQTPTF